jgi:hypothetical protein
MNGRCSSCTASKPTICDEQCTNVLTDPYNCGGCDNLCPSDELCENGQCAKIHCGGNTPTLCNAACTNVLTDPKNCGGCSIACPKGEKCEDGTCSGPPTGAGCNVEGNENICGNTCTNWSTDPNNCGGCDNVCDQSVGENPCVGSKCSGGGTPTCADPRTPDACGSSCTSVKTDPNNCGSCGNDCTKDANKDDSCVNGVCCKFPFCNGPKFDPCYNTPNTPDLCADNLCTDLQTDASNCGQCGHLCNEPSCVAGSCCDAAAGTPDACPGPNGVEFCTDVSSDPSNCGGCGNQCAPNQACDTSKTPPCQVVNCKDPDLPTNCGGECVNTQTDDLDCGGCGIVCDTASGQQCIGGTCQQASCPDPQHPTLCGNHCVDTLTNPGNCGSPQGSGCGVFCDPGQFCSGGSCQCPSGQLDCPSSGGHNQCTDTQTDNNNCGGCNGLGGVVCGAGTSCQAGQCVSDCPTSSTSGASKISGTSNPASCSPCSAPNSTSCSGTCVDVNNDANNCGACGTVCTGGLCVGGKCNNCYDPDAKDDPFDDPDCD